jgi:hypothetical protein
MVGRVLGQEEEAAAALAQRRLRPRALVDGEVVEDHDVTARERRRQLGLDVGVEALPVDRALDHPRGGQPIGAQGGDEGLGAPPGEGGAGLEPRTAAGAAAPARHLGVDRGLIEEDEAAGHVPHAWLTPLDPEPAPAGDVGARELRGHQLFFYM